MTDADREAGQNLISTWLHDRNPQGLTDRVIEAIARARAEERERVAALAVKESADERLTGKHHAKNFRLRDANMCRGAAEALKRFAAAIRARGEGGK